MSEQTISEFIRQLDIAGKSIAMYSENHPSAKGALDQAFTLLQGPLQERSLVTLSVFGADILVDGEPVRRGDRAIERFVKTLDTRDVRSLSFTRNVTREDLVQTLRILNLTPQRIRELGGIEALLEKEGVAAVQANKVRYGIIGESGSVAGVAPGAVAMTVDEGLLAQLMSTVQAGDSDATAQNVERSLEDTGAPDTSEALFKIFQNMAQGTVEPLKPLRERFLEMFRSFSPKMQGKLLLTAVLNRSLLEKSSLSGFYHELKPEELESPVTAVLMLGLASEKELQGFADALIADEKLVLSEPIRQKMIQRGLLKIATPEPPVEDIRKKTVLDADDYPKLLHLVRQEIAAKNLDEADKISKRLLAGMAAPQPEQRAAAVRVLPLMVQELASNEKWKNVETSLSFLVANHFRKESDANVNEAYAAYLGAGFRKKYELKDYASCKEYLNLLSSKPESKAAIAAGLAQGLGEMREEFRKDLKEIGSISEMILEYLRACGGSGADFLLEWLGVEEDQRVRSRIIGFTERLEHSSLLPEMEKRLADSRWYVVRNMVTISGRLNLPNSVPFMMQAMQDPDIRVAKEVVKALFKSVTASNSPLVMHLLMHPDKSIRLQALRLVTLFGLEKGEARVNLQKMAATDPVPEVRTLASSILG